METRGWKLCICFGLLSLALAKDASQSIAGAREDGSSSTKFNLVHDSKSHLFSSCFAELNTIEATLQAIEVDEGKEYIRYLIDSDAEVTWEDVEGVDDTIACAFKAYEAGSLMFKHSNGVCSLATEGVYDPENASSHGEEVFIIDPLELCSTPLGKEAPGHQYYSWLCETNCGSSGILTDQTGAAVNQFSIPDEILECCPTPSSPCMFYKGLIAPPCDVDRICYFMGMMLPSALPGPELDQLIEVFTSPKVPGWHKILVNVRYENENWYHFPGKVLVNSEEWNPNVDIPATEGFVGVNKNGLLVPVGDTELVFMLCREQEELPKCPETD